MELRHLRYFVALSNAPTFTAAAERVFVTQSTLSHQIRQLEDEIGVELFRRVGKRRVVLTDAGQLFLNHAVRALSEVDTGRALLTKNPEEVTGELRVAAGNVFNQHFIPECASRFMVKFPCVKLVIDEFEANRIAEATRAGELHVGITWAPTDLGELTFEPLHVEALVLVVGSAHPWSERKSVRMAELHNQPLALMSHRFATRDMLDSCFRACGARPSVVAEINSIAPLLKIVSRTNVGTIVSHYSVLERPELRVIHLQSPTPTRTPGILWRAREQPPFVRSFVSVVREVAFDATMSLRPAVLKEDAIRENFDPESGAGHSARR